MKSLSCETVDFTEFFQIRVRGKFFNFYIVCVYTVWKLRFSATQILREINFGHSKSLETAFLTFFAVQYFDLLRIFNIFKGRLLPKIEIQSLQNGQNRTFWALKSANFDFT